MITSKSNLDWRVYRCNHNEHLLAILLLIVTIDVVTIDVVTKYYQKCSSYTVVSLVVKEVPGLLFKNCFQFLSSVCESIL